ncbi:hypothetical protein [Fulvivirga sedimenti]|uniref:Outer membrane protein beta-barrel domain-containing protein n=1 Tax=Fulvivirga sedimenti TaxID=2879465 RepID=A0A9X1KXC3_9BACT|nr:hypothetical protein [Fulvivirga sedimenti]MCA6074824.1 hypothetical protein [Fulvivirga sedimenti]MCA6076001.1 hypothetical protein [Fulvivirga sedimenti]MCA6077129.1 hypothetical protein [Fulvivirga sedimenti]
MKRIILFTAMILGTSLYSTAQDKPDKYILSGGELIFSFANVGSGYDNIIRFSPFFNAQSWRVYDWGEFGLFHGLAIRNVGFIAEDRSTNTRVKFRTYNIGVPVGFKYDFSQNVGIYAGYEFEVPFNFKQKTFINEKKEDKFNSWFSDRTPTLAHGLFVGFQFVNGTNIKFKYYLNSFLNTDYEAIVDGTPFRPYEDLDAHVFYFALTFNIFKDLDVYVLD